jgi:hypothetical protein
VSIHVFVDESVRRDYLVCAVAVEARRIEHSRRIMRSLIPPGQRRLHFAKERDDRRRQFLARIVQLPVQASFFMATGHAVPARRTCLQDALVSLADTQVSRLVIELAEPEYERDRQSIAGVAGKVPWLDTASVEHMPGHTDPMLWVPDALAWAYGAGGSWRSQVEQLIDPG